MAKFRIKPVPGGWLVQRRVLGVFWTTEENFSQHRRPICGPPHFETYLEARGRVELCLAHERQLAAIRREAKGRRTEYFST